MKLRCWPGCIAFTTDPRFYGRTFEVMQLHGYIGPDVTVEPGAFWYVKAAGWLPDARHFTTATADGHFLWPDHLLRPITPPPAADATDSAELVRDVLERAQGAEAA